MVCALESHSAETMASIRPISPIDPYLIHLLQRRNRRHHPPDNLLQPLPLGFLHLALLPPQHHPRPTPHPPLLVHPRRRHPLTQRLLLAPRTPQTQTLVQPFLVCHRSRGIKLPHLLPGPSPQQPNLRPHQRHHPPHASSRPPLLLPHSPQNRRRNLHHRLESPSASNLHQLLRRKHRPSPKIPLTADPRVLAANKEIFSRFPILKNLPYLGNPQPRDPSTTAATLSTVPSYPPRSSTTAQSYLKTTC